MSLPAPSVSVVIATIDRPAALAACLEGLDRLEGACVEVVVVVGPGGDATLEQLAQSAAVAAVVASPVRNLSRSRNLGLAAASGDLIAFLDDDAVPTERWLADLLPHFDDPEVGAVGGIVFDYTGHSLQARYSRCTPAGDATVVLAPPIRGLTETPASGTFDYPIGTNMVIRASAAADVGGFDEQFDYFHDETDIARRLLDRGWIVRVGSRGGVVHRYLSSATRGVNRIASDRRSILVNRAYFAVRHQLPDQGVAAVRRDFEQFVSHHRNEMVAASFDSTTLSRFEEHVKEASLRLDGWLQTPPAPRRHHHDPTSVVARHRSTTGTMTLRRHIVVVGAAPATESDRNLARALASDGHTVRLLDVDGGPHHRVDFGDGFWHHRLGDLPLPLPSDLADALSHAERATWRSHATTWAELARIESELWRPTALVIESANPISEVLRQREFVIVDPIALHRARSLEERIALLDGA